MSEGRFRHGERQENVHRRVTRQACIAHAFGNPQAPVDLHGSGVAALHFRKVNCGFVALDQRATHAAATQVKSQS